MDFKIENLDGRPVAVLADQGKVRNWFLSQLLTPSKYFIIELLHEITQIEKRLCGDRECQDLYVYIAPFLERITIEFSLPEDAVEVQQIEIRLEVAKLLLLEWGTMLHRWHIEQKE